MCDKRRFHIFAFANVDKNYKYKQKNAMENRKTQKTNTIEVLLRVD